jgi:hypothetical protein
VTPDDLSTVQESWTRLRSRPAALVGELTIAFADVGPSTIEAASRARWLYAAVDELVGLLAAPSSLATSARALGETWPDRHTAPCFAVEGQAWLEAAAMTQPDWSDETARAWKQAWLLLSDVLAAESLSPFADHRAPRDPEPDPLDPLRPASPTPPNQGTLP